MSDSPDAGEHPRSTFLRRFARAATVFADAPGRVNLIGEHTDYSGGFVLPLAISKRASVYVAPSDDRTVRLVSSYFGGSGIHTYELGGELKGNDFADYVKGVTSALLRAGHVIGGFDAYVESTVPMGSGLSSSAALSVALLRALRGTFDLGLDDVELAVLARRAENDFVGVPVGIMDPMAASLADERTALFIDTRSLSVERVPLPPSIELVVLDSGVKHSHATGEYRVRREECERAAGLLGVKELRDAAGRLADVAGLPHPLDRRARHVVGENERVLGAVAALRSGDAPLLGRLMVESHASLRDDYEVSVGEVDRLVARALEEPEVFGARMTGGGFGGAVVVLVAAGTGEVVAERVVADVPGSSFVATSGGA